LRCNPCLLVHLTQAKGSGELLPSLGVRRRRPSVVRRKLFQKSSPLKVLDQWKPNLVWIITRVYLMKKGKYLQNGYWNLLQNCRVGRSWCADHFYPHVRFLILLTVFELLPKTCNFTICSIFSNSGHEVISLLSSNFQNVNTFRPLFQNL
jgi:hypothetical protein